MRLVILRRIKGLRLAPQLVWGGRASMASRLPHNVPPVMGPLSPPSLSPAADVWPGCARVKCSRKLQITMLAASHPYLLWNTGLMEILLHAS